MNVGAALVAARSARAVVWAYGVLRLAETVMGVNNNCARALDLVESALSRLGQDIDAARGFTERFAAECGYALVTGRCSWLLREDERRCLCDLLLPWYKREDGETEDV